MVLKLLYPVLVTSLAGWITKKTCVQCLVYHIRHISYIDIVSYHIISHHIVPYRIVLYYVYIYIALYCISMHMNMHHEDERAHPWSCKIEATLGLQSKEGAVNQHLYLYKYITIYWWCIYIYTHRYRYIYIYIQLHIILWAGNTYVYIYYKLLYSSYIHILVKTWSISSPEKGRQKFHHSSARGAQWPRLLRWSTNPSIPTSHRIFQLLPRWITGE